MNPFLPKPLPQIITLSKCLFCQIFKYDQHYTCVECIMCEDYNKISYMTNLWNILPCKFQVLLQIDNEFWILVLNQYHQLFLCNMFLKQVCLIWLSFATFIFNCYMESSKSCIQVKPKLQLFYLPCPLAHLLGTPTLTLSCHLSKLKVKLLVRAKTCLFSGKRFNLFPLHPLFHLKLHLFIFLIGLR